MNYQSIPSVLGVPLQSSMVPFHQILVLCFNLPIVPFKPRQMNGFAIIIKVPVSVLYIAHMAPLSQQLTTACKYLDIC